MGVQAIGSVVDGASHGPEGGVDAFEAEFARMVEKVGGKLRSELAPWQAHGMDFSPIAFHSVGDAEEKVLRAHEGLVVFGNAQAWIGEQFVLTVQKIFRPGDDRAGEVPGQVAVAEQVQGGEDLVEAVVDGAGGGAVEVMEDLEAHGLGSAFWCGRGEWIEDANPFTGL